MRGEAVTLFLCGDVMLGRGVDQILPHPGDPALREPYIRDSRAYVELAEETSGPIPRPVGFSWPWGEALPELDRAAPDVRVVNLETSITRGGAFAPGKEIHYRMNPANLPGLAVARPDVCVLANNHVLDGGRPGLDDTLDTLATAGIRVAGAGRDMREARRPAAVPAGDHGRVLVFACGTPSAGIPAGWAARGDRSGVDLVSEYASGDAAALAHRVRQLKRPGDLAVVSIHWGSNWGYDIPEDQIRFAHALIDGGVDLVHGHSSHHPRPLEIHRDKLILYGCGDLIDDYEGIGGYEGFRDDLRVLYFATLRPDTGALLGLRMVVFRARRMRLCRAPHEDAVWLARVLGRTGSALGTRIDLGPDDVLTAHRAEPEPP
ncbi:CapA family protein [Streptomyces botrytidirepellens]|uniref:CapA family protein n=1 Tax=Streptomyces botrytidirepellens TaxID=2486417 RepID=A0A3M8SY63_9ACTN|nr:CapA family protein [Streptomyces botrytidirepellens]RNF85763.1 CapA family protein [Streptomyces botrytidirepellens]